jgi:hypothetical protein
MIFFVLDSCRTDILPAIALVLCFGHHHLFLIVCYSTTSLKMMMILFYCHCQSNLTNVFMIHRRMNLMTSLSTKGDNYILWPTSSGNPSDKPSSRWADWALECCLKEGCRNWVCCFKVMKWYIIRYNSICSMCGHWWHILPPLPLSYSVKENRQAQGRNQKSK